MKFGYLINRVTSDPWAPTTGITLIVWIAPTGSVWAAPAGTPTPTSEEGLGPVWQRIEVD